MAAKKLEMRSGRLKIECRMSSRKLNATIADMTFEKTNQLIF
jgi:hypothetical protein